MGVLCDHTQPGSPRLLRPAPRSRRPPPPRPTRPGKPPRRDPARLPAPPNPLRRTQSLGTPSSRRGGLTTYSPGMSNREPGVHAAEVKEVCAPSPAAGALPFLHAPTAHRSVCKATRQQRISMIVPRPHDRPISTHPMADEALETFTVRLPRWPIFGLFGRNPLLRASDRIEALVMALTVMVSLLAVPVAAAVGTAVHASRGDVSAQLPAPNTPARSRHHQRPS